MGTASCDFTSDVARASTKTTPTANSGQILDVFEGRDAADLRA